jgi:lipopolysaccharide transport system ATP-binding protein
MSSSLAIKVENLSKCYQIYEHPRDRLKQFILPRVRRFLGLPEKKYYREFWSLRDVSFEVKKGETVGIIGRNGSGKSTLLQMICGTLNQSSGKIETQGRIAALLELGSGFNPEFTGRENVYMNAAVLGLSHVQVQERFADIEKFADIGEFIDQPVKTYSSGMMVKLAFSVIAHVDADILVVDEALAVGDAFFTQKCMRFIRQFQKNGGTLLFVSHDTGAVINLCESAVLLEQGRLTEAGSPKKVSERYLSTLYSETQNIGGTVEELPPENTSVLNQCEELYDFRKDLINSSTLRNDIEVFRFNPSADGFGAGGAKITDVKLLTTDGKNLSWVVGGEAVVLEIKSLAYEDLLSPIIGFDFKDRLGQTIFGDNTYIVYQDNPQRIHQGERFHAMFFFRMPILPIGDYSLTVAIADGTQDAHVQHHWLHEALILKVNSSSVCFGLMGIPMSNILLSRFK